MIQTPPGWLRQVRADQVQLRPPRERRVGEFRYRERYGPLRSARQVVAAKLSMPTPGIETLAVGDPEKLVTVEGEYAALVKLEAAVRSRPALRIMGIVFADTFTTLLDGISANPDYFDEFETIARDLVRRTVLLLGVRRRLFLYQPPPGWQALPQVLVTNWYPPDFPANHARLIVFPAAPRLEAPAGILDALVAADRKRGIPIASVTGPRHVESRHGLTGLSWHVETHPPEHGRLTRLLAVFEDRRYIYPLRLDVADSTHPGPVEAGIATFEAVCDSVEPLPDPAQAIATSRREPFEFWAL